MGEKDKKREQEYLRRLQQPRPGNPCTGCRMRCANCQHKCCGR